MSQNFQQSTGSPDGRPIVAIVGRPNVGKSTFFNRICGKRKAIESDIPKTTRDRIYGEVLWCGKNFTLIDTAGLFEKDKTDNFQSVTRAAVEMAISEADKIIFLLDAVDGVTSFDREIAKSLHQSGKEIFLAVNKADNAKREGVTREILSLGIKNPSFISAISGRGVADFLDQLTADFSPAVEKLNHTEEIIGVAIVGRPNVGKSTLLNSLAGKEFSIVNESPGTTRDTIDAIINFGGKKIQFVDTAGIRRRGKIDRQIEKYSVIRAMEAIKNSSVVIVLLDGIEGITNQDAHLVGNALDQGKSVIIVVNKIDAWDEGEFEEKMAETVYVLQKDLAFLPFAPVIFISAKEGTNLNILLKKINEIYSARFFEIPESELKTFTNDIKTANQQLPEILGFWQEKTNPPIFKLFVKNKKRIHFSSVRYIENRLRDQFPFPGTPIFIDMIEKKK